MRTLALPFVTLILACNLYSLGFAADKPTASLTDATSKESFELGFGVGYRNPIYKGIDVDYLPIPLIYYQNGGFFFRGTQIGYRFYQNKGLSFDALAEWVWRGYDADDSRDLLGMDDRDPTILGGLGASFYDGWGITRLSYAHDLLGRSDGQEVTLRYFKQFVKDQWTFTPAIGIRWQGSSMVDYYYGVRAKEATPSRPQYSVGDSWRPFVGMTARYQFNEKWSSLLLLRYDWLDSNIKDSPIVDKDYRIKALFGVLYQF
jgi:outer membrane protein